MTKATLADLIEEQVFEAKRKLPDWMYPLQWIKEEVTDFNQIVNIFLVTKEGTRMAYNREYVTLVRKTFKDATWFLSQPTKSEGAKGLCILVGVLPKDHFLLLSGKRFKKVMK